MIGVHLHLILNHVPIFSVVFGIGIIVWGIYVKSTQVRKLGTILLIIGSIMSYVALESGEIAEDELEENSISISHETIHEHEEIAEIAFWFSVIMGGLAIISLVSTKMNTRFQSTLNGVVLVAAVLTFIMLVYTAYEGGKIRHSQELGQSSELFDPNLDF